MYWYCTILFITILFFHLNELVEMFSTVVLSVISKWTYAVTYYGLWLLDGLWIGWFDLLTPYTEKITALPLSTHFTVHSYTQTLGFSVVNSRILVTYFNTGTVTVSLSYTPNITVL
jgi:hypothetical protein